MTEKIPTTAITGEFDTPIGMMTSKEKGGYSIGNVRVVPGAISGSWTEATDGRALAIRWQKKLRSSQIEYVHRDAAPCSKTHVGKQFTTQDGEHRLQASANRVLVSKTEPREDHRFPDTERVIAPVDENNPAGATVVLSLDLLNLVVQAISSKSRGDTRFVLFVPPPDEDGFVDRSLRVMAWDDGNNEPGIGVMMPFQAYPKDFAERFNETRSDWVRAFREAEARLAGETAEQVQAQKEKERIDAMFNEVAGAIGE